LKNVAESFVNNVQRQQRRVKERCAECWATVSLAFFMLFISVHMVSTAKQSQLVHNTAVYLFNLSLLFHLPDMLRQ
jgi:hypothetical protein